MAAEPPSPHPPSFRAAPETQQKFCVLSFEIPEHPKATARGDGIRRGRCSEVGPALPSPPSALPAPATVPCGP
ncbi:hypothetical protein HMPREF9440_00685 [Sutterella parvirubra YIT 11816]|uniref:Uncharacterized protein n=1 Tax=Sutterella parvirubra YIT 11816 TaxID=762967 RepID=H3KD79_9BURK|nr:hypothetical protein HMPREF9440_00685 [Sutterella parvirubra YIT 11816]